eukprot:773794-Alexandrium_andersonii.AAC.1
MVEFGVSSEVFRKLRSPSFERLMPFCIVRYPWAPAARRSPAAAAAAAAAALLAPLQLRQHGRAQHSRPCDL